MTAYINGVEVTGIPNPMTTAGDMIVADTNGVPIRLPAGNEAEVQTIVGGLPVWQAPNKAIVAAGKLSAYAQFS